jgi:hypothetical protein
MAYGYVSNVSLSALKKMASDAFSTVTRNDWARVIDRVRKGKENWWKKYGLMEERTE